MKWLNIAIKEAEKSFHRKRVGAVVFNKKQFISRGHNYSNRSIRKHHPRFRKTPFSIHAEVDAIIKAKRNLSGHSIMVVRINNEGELRYSKPCEYCVSYLKYVGIKTVYFSTGDYPFIEKMKINA